LNRGELKSFLLFLERIDEMMDKEEVIIEIKKLGKMLDNNEITLQMFNDKISFLIRYKW